MPLKTFDETLTFLRTSLDAARIGAKDKLYGLRRLDRLVQAVETELQPEAEFMLLGSHPAPVAELRTVFETSGWRYLQITRHDGPVAYYRNQLGLAWVTLRERADLLHVLHSPLVIE